MKRETFPIVTSEERALDRRRFLQAGGAAALLVLGGEWAARRRRAPAASPPLVLEDADAIMVGTAREIVAPGGRDALAVRLDDATVVCFERRCPHLGCPVRWATARGRFECPCHAAAFDARTGAVLTGPPRRGLTPIPLDIA